MIKNNTNIDEKKRSCEYCVFCGTFLMLNGGKEAYVRCNPPVWAGSSFSMRIPAWDLGLPCPITRGKAWEYRIS